MITCVIHGAKELTIENRPEPRPQDGEVLVRFGAGGICGSDLHYYHEGGILDFKIREPLVLGHEVAGEVVEIGAGVGSDRTSRHPPRRAVGGAREQISSKGIGTDRDIPF